MRDWNDVSLLTVAVERLECHGEKISHQIGSPDPKGNPGYQRPATARFRFWRIASPKPETKENVTRANDPGSGTDPSSTMVGLVDGILSKLKKTAISGGTKSLGMLIVKSCGLIVTEAGLIISLSDTFIDKVHVTETTLSH